MLAGAGSDKARAADWRNGQKLPLTALATTAPGIAGYESVMKKGERLRVPRFDRE
jgi:hypothetical protein